VFQPERKRSVKEVNPFFPGTLEGNRFLAMDLVENRSEENAVVFLPYLSAASFGGEVADEQFPGVNNDALVF
jgi:hypothetical protein